MPRLAIDYAKNFNYKIVCKDLSITDCYVGSSTNWSHRKATHKYSCNHENAVGYNLKVYTFIRAHGGWDNWEMVLIEYFPCNNEPEQARRERYWTEELKATLNCLVQGRTKQEYRDGHKEQQTEYQVEYRAENKEHLAEYHVEWYQENKEYAAEQGAIKYQKNKEQILAQQATLYTCACSSICTVGKKSRHEKSKKHLKYMLTL